MFLIISIALCSYSEASVDTQNYQTHPPKHIVRSTFCYSFQPIHRGLSLKETALSTVRCRTFIRSASSGSNGVSFSEFEVKKTRRKKENKHKVKQKESFFFCAHFKSLQQLNSIAVNVN